MFVAQLLVCTIICFTDCVIDWTIGCGYYVMCPSDIFPILGEVKSSLFRIVLFYLNLEMSFPYLCYLGTVSVGNDVVSDCAILSPQKIFLMRYSRPIFSLFSSFQCVQLTESIQKICWWLDSNRRSPVLEASALPTEPQPLPPLKIISVSSTNHPNRISFIQICLALTKLERFEFQLICLSVRETRQLSAETILVTNERRMMDHF